MKIYAISGLGADQRVFDYLSLNAELVPLDWIDPLKGEPLSAYSARLASEIKKKEPFCLMGVSFGGLVAVEISKLVSPALTILVSSASTRHELPAMFRLIGRIGIATLVPQSWFVPPLAIARRVFGTKHELLRVILAETDTHFAKWAVNQLLVWGQEERLQRIFKIHGTKDLLLPPSLSKGDRVVEGGGHFMIVDRAAELSDLINAKLAEVSGGVSNIESKW